MDVAVVGGGVIGLACAVELADRGISVTVLERGEPGAEASGAAAGILGPQSEAHAPGPMVDLCVRSFAMYPAWLQRLGAEAGFRACGTLHLAFTEAEGLALEAMRDWQRAVGLRAELRNDARASVALWLPDEGQVDNRLLVKALRRRAEVLGVAFLRAAATAIEPGAVVHAGGAFHAGRVVLAAGCWSADLRPVPVFPVRGQLMIVDAPPPPSVVFGAGGYLVPREGRTLVGATVERAGFDKALTAEGLAELSAVAAKLGVRGRVTERWAGLRPGSPDGLPFLGELNGAVVATGHFRNGILLAPVTADIVRALVRGEPSPVPLAPFAPGRPLPEVRPR